MLDGLLARGVATRGSQHAWLAEARRQAHAQLDRDGLPGPRNEAWKYSSLRALGQRVWRVGDAVADAPEFDLARIELAGIQGPRLVFVNGTYRADLSSVAEAAGLQLRNLSSLIDEDPDSLKAFLGRAYDDSADVFARLNTALAGDGPVIRVAPGVIVEPAVHLVIAGTGSEADLAWQLRGIVDIGAGARLRLIEHHVGDVQGSQLGNVLEQVVLRAGARLDLLQLQNAPESVSLVRRTEVVLEADAHLELRTMEAGAHWMRHDLAVSLIGDRSRLVSRGVFALRGRQHADTRLDVRHSARSTSSDIVWRGVADQRSRGVFHGAITVAPGADGTDAQLGNKNLLLSDQAEIDTQPVLEIHADEVKAAHGATVGQLDERALFYLRSRGLSAEQARALLILAFCRVGFDTIENETLRQHIDGLLLERLPRLEDVAAAGGEPA